jgi:hypothetical protein
MKNVEERQEQNEVQANMLRTDLVGLQSSSFSQKKTLERSVEQRNGFYW